MICKLILIGTIWVNPCNITFLEEAELDNTSLYKCIIYTGVPRTRVKIPCSEVAKLINGGK